MTPPLVERATRHQGRTAVVAPKGIYSYDDLLDVSGSIAARLLGELSDLSGARVCFLTQPGWRYVAVQWGVWRAGGIAVPLAISHPPPELAYVLDDVRPKCVVVHPDFKSRIKKIAKERNISVLNLQDLLKRARSRRPRLPDVEPSRPAMILYTSGTTGTPKGVVITHANVAAQTRSLTEAWEWSADDRILLHLPLHHVHGIVNILACSLWNGATCEILPRFTAIDVWERLSRGEITLYMAVPTVYRRLADTWRRADPETRAAWRAGAQACRLMVSGSAALPAPMLARWEEITGQRLLERYGMTEIGMALSNPLHGERRPGRVGSPLPSIEVRLVGDGDAEPAIGEPGEVQVRGDTVFSGYWERPQETERSFTREGWFRTGDVASVDEHGSYRILGRSDQDILKTGGEKISALEIEDALRAHPGVSDCAVVGIEDEEWGDRVCAAVVHEPKYGLGAEDLIAFAQERLAPYKVPKHVLIVDQLPRTPLGKVAKPTVRELFHENQGENT